MKAFTDDSDREPGDPTPQEIRRRCAKIRRGWPAWRLATPGRIDWEPPTVPARIEFDCPAGIRKRA